MTRSDPLRPGQVVRQRSKHQLDPGDRERPLPARDRVEHDRGPPGAGDPDEACGPQGRDPRRRRSAADLADEAREAAPAAPPRDGRLAAECADARDPRRGPPGRELHPRAHRGVRSGRRGRLPVHARRGGEGDRRACGGDPGDRPRIRTRAARGDLLHAWDHRALDGDRQHLVAREPRADDRPPRLRVDRPQRAARPEQRPGPQRRRGKPGLLPRLPGDRRPRDDAEVLGGLGRRAPGDAGLPARPDDLRPARRAHPGDVLDRREPGADRAERPPRRGGPRGAGLPGRAGHLPERVGAGLRGRRPAGLVLRREGRHVHEYGAPRQPRAEGGARSRAGARGLAHRGRSGPRARGRVARVPDGRRHLERVRRPGAELVRDPLRPARGDGPPVAVPRPGPSRARRTFTPRTRRGRTERASSSPSSTSRRSSCRTPSTRSSCRPAGRSTTTTRQE